MYRCLIWKEAPKSLGPGPSWDCSFQPGLPTVAMRYSKCVFKTPENYVQDVCGMVAGGGGTLRVGWGRECGAWLGKVLYVYCPTELAEQPFEVDAIVILVFHKKKWRQKRLSNLSQVPVAVITPFFTVAWQCPFFAKTCLSFLFTIFPTVPSPPPSPLHRERASGWWGAPRHCVS